MAPHWWNGMRNAGFGGPMMSKEDLAEAYKAMNRPRPGSTNTPIGPFCGKNTFESATNMTDEQLRDKLYGNI